MNKFIEEYNEVASNKHNRDVYDVYVNEWGVLQYSITYDTLFGLYSFYNHTNGKSFTGLTQEKAQSIKEKELNYQIELLKEAGRI